MSFNEKHQYIIHAYKYNGWLYRSVEYPYILYENENVICCYLPKEKIQLIKAKETFDKSSRKKFFFSKNSSPMIWFFFKNKWFNVIAIFKNKAPNYYVNIASPFYIEENAIKYIDFDLDIKINENNEFKIVDKNEFQINSEKWNYGKELIEKIEEANEEVITLIKEKWFKNLFSSEEVDELKKFIDKKFINDEYKFNI